MGNFYSPLAGYGDRSAWKSVGKLKQGEVLRNQEGLELEIYDVRMIEGNLKQQTSIYERRKLKPGFWIRVLDYCQNDSLSCGIVMYRVVTQRIVRFREVKSLVDEEAVSSIKQVLIQYQELVNTFGHFKIEEDMIGTCTEGSVKIWVNQNLGSNVPEPNLQSLKQEDAEVIGKVVEVICRKAIRGSAIRERLTALKQQNGITIQSAIDILSNVQLGYRKVMVSQIGSEGSNFTFDPQKTKYKRPLSSRSPFSPAKIPPVAGMRQRHTSPPKTIPQYGQNQVIISPGKYRHNYSIPKYALQTFSVPTSITARQQLPQYYGTSSHPQPFLQHQRFSQALQNLARQSQQLRLQSTLKQARNPVPENSPQPSPNIHIQSTVKRRYVQPAKTDQKDPQQFKLVKSHVFVSNQDLYSAFDYLANEQNVKIQQSKILRRLASQTGSTTG